MRKPRITVFDPSALTEPEPVRLALVRDFGIVSLRVVDKSGAPVSRGVIARVTDEGLQLSRSIRGDFGLPLDEFGQIRVTREVEKSPAPAVPKSSRKVISDELKAYLESHPTQLRALEAIATESWLRSDIELVEGALNGLTPTTVGAAKKYLVDRGYTVTK